MSRQRRRSAPPGLTLIELLVVMGIVAVLVGLLMPALASARRSGQAIQCASNLRALGLGIRAYAQAYDGYLPPSEPPPPPSGWDYVRWPSILVGTKSLAVGTAPDEWSVAKGSTDVFQCPSDVTVEPFDGVNVHFVGTSYITNGRVMPRATFYPMPFREPQLLRKISNPSKRLLLTEKDGNLMYGGPIGLSPAGSWCYQAVIDRVRPRHGKRRKPDGTANVLFVDAHVAAMSYAEITRPAEQALAGNPNPDPEGLWGTERQ